MASKKKSDEIPIRIAYNGVVVCMNVEAEVEFEDLCYGIMELVEFDEDDEFTLKWIDEEGDPITMSSDMEFDEAKRLFFANGAAHLVINVFEGISEEPGQLMDGEERLYRRGARRWKKVYQYREHSFVAKRFGKLNSCPICGDIIWGLGRQGVKCMNCKFHVHKRCHLLTKHDCGDDPPDGIYGSTRVLDRISSGRRSPPEPEFDIGVKDFDFISVLGRGSYAKVMMVRFKETGRIYAMKILKKELICEEDDIDWVHTEKKVFELASNHPFLVGMHSCFQTKSRIFYTIEFVNGGDLMFHMQKFRKLEESHAVFYSAEITLGLNYLHERGILYRDLKLDNVLLDSAGHCKITDYGMCKENIKGSKKTGTFCGTPNYIAPEILKGEPYGMSVDWWALGVLLYEMLAGKSPFDSTPAADNPGANSEDYLFQCILEKAIRIPRSFTAEASAVLNGFLNKDPEERLGCVEGEDGEDPFTVILEHPFYREIDWELLEQRQIDPPYTPDCGEGEEILGNFDKQFTDEPVILTPDDPKELKKIDQSEFEGFEYINPMLMTDESEPV